MKVAGYIVMIIKISSFILCIFGEEKHIFN